MHGNRSGEAKGCVAGGRRLQREEIPFRTVSRSFAGIGPSLSPGRIVAAAKAAAGGYPWPRRLIDLLDRLVAFTRAEDWRPGRRPIVWPSNQVLAEAWGLKRTQVKARIRQLASAGLIVIAESPNGQRWGRRDDKGRIVEAYGFDLSPLAGRYREFAETAARLREERRRRGRARRRITIALRHLAQLRELAGETSAGLEARFATWTEEAATAAETGRRAEQADEGNVAAAAIEGIVELAESTLGATLGRRTSETSTGESDPVDARAPDSDPMGPAARPPITTTTELLDLHEVQRSQGPSSGADGARRSPPGRRGSATEPGRGLDPVSTSAGVAKDGPARRRSADEISVGEILRLAPSLAEHLAAGEAVTWASVVDAADRLRSALGVSRPAWIEGCARLGREGAAVIVGIIAAKRKWLTADDPGYPRIAGAYFRGMLDRHAAGQLNLGRTLWGMRAAREERLRRQDTGARP